MCKNIVKNISENPIVNLKILKKKFQFSKRFISEILYVNLFNKKTKYILLNNQVT